MPTRCRRPSRSTAGDVLSPALLGGPMRFWLGYVDGEPVAVSAAVCTRGLNLVTYVAALPAARGRGVGGAVTWAATLADPDGPAILVASDDGRPVYERLGYLALERWTAWLRPGGAAEPPRPFAGREHGDSRVPALLSVHG